ncbi:unnamed protein product [Paramecium sonneborni]|uniref:Uncharacterized protein n=1 Tax=Paramecium sonneborni TaxID=65129 RepID=A0A8S1RS08_9CILI|nr:unnamed protein product [Paramecium sonneborni]
MAHYNKGSALEELKQYKDAIVCYDKAINLNPKNANAYNNKASALHEMKQYKKAIEFHDNALSLGQNAIFFLNKAESLLALGKKEEAKKYYQIALNAECANKGQIKQQLQTL